jgi:hypothetical protein
MSSNGEDPFMTVIDQTQEAVQDYSNRALDTLVLWTEVNQKVARQLLDLSATSAKEGLQLLTQVQSANIDALRSAVTAVSERQGAVEEYQRNPADWYRNTALAGIEQAKQGFQVLQGNAQALTHYAETVRGTTTEATQAVRDAFETVATKVREDAAATAKATQAPVAPAAKPAPKAKA